MEPCLAIYDKGTRKLLRTVPLHRDGDRLVPAERVVGSDDELIYAAIPDQPHLVPVEGFGVLPPLG